ncbi:Sulfotransferase domain protein [Enhygromyxa salina]|uniref:Sulfotransferase domain protein n=1 Tax=Enhygromyxa salina TaxID=215803 RepID=A0A2S9YCY9_9BACT|nr:sulfotransferase domain-containing protein [Enhygromyxa salina]PRQ02965.1 Sulfotransferase domain protein [Enhygromyxa salina]
MAKIHPATFAVVMTPFILATKTAAALGVATPLLRAFLSATYPRRVAEFETYEATKHDVFIATFAKSGTNLAMQIAQQIAYLGEAEFDHIHDFVPWPEANMPGLVALDDMRVCEASPTKLRVIKTHASLELVPYAAQARYLTVIRDPKEVVVSAYHFILGLLGVKHRISAQQWAALVVEPGLLCEIWAAHTASAWAVRERPNQLVIEFGELLADQVGMIERIAAFMGVSPTAAQLEAIIERSSFAYMRAHEAQFQPPRLPLVGRGAKMIRRGQSKASDELLDAEARAEIDRFCRAELERRESDFPYDEMFGGA